MEKISKNVRLKTINISYNAKTGHLGSALSMIDILVYLYHKQLKENDHFLLSKAHGCASLYAVLHSKKLINDSIINRFGIDNGTLNKHQDKNKKYGITWSGGSLGHGLPVGVGLTYGCKENVYVILGDGECQEGSVWESAILAGSLKLMNLTVIVDYNRLQGLPQVVDIKDIENFKKRWDSCGFFVYDINGHNFDELDKVFRSKVNKPKVIIARTIKGKGVKMLEGKFESHYKVLSKSEYKKIMDELS